MKEKLYKIRNFFKNLYNYRKILCEDEQFDCNYLLDLEKFKMQLMIKAFNEKYHDVNHTDDIRWMSICIKLIDIIQEEDSALEYVDYLQFKIVKYVNTNNAFRFRFKDNISNDQIFMKDTLRQRKAAHLYYMIRYNYSYGWWD